MCSSKVIEMMQKTFPNTQEAEVFTGAQGNPVNFQRFNEVSKSMRLQLSS